MFYFSGGYKRVCRSQKVKLMLCRFYNLISNHHIKQGPIAILKLLPISWKYIQKEELRAARKVNHFGNN